MRKFLFLLSVIVFATTSCNKKPAEFTKLGEYTPYNRIHEKLNGKVEKVVQKVYWATPEGETYKKGNRMTLHEHDSVVVLNDFETVFDESGDVKYTAYLDENDIVFAKLELSKENNVLISSQYTYKDTLRVYNKLKCNDRGDIIGATQYRAANDTLVYSYVYKFSLKGDTETLQSYNYKGLPGSKMVATTDKDGQFLTVAYTDKEGVYTGGHENIYNERGNVIRVNYFDKDKKVTSTYPSYNIEYDKNGNWIMRLMKKNDQIPYFIERTYTYFE